jgi:hypothetical protein
VRARRQRRAASSNGSTCAAQSSAPERERAAEREQRPRGPRASRRDQPPRAEQPRAGDPVERRLREAGEDRERDRRRDERPPPQRRSLGERVHRDQQPRHPRDGIEGHVVVEADDHRAAGREEEPGEQRAAGRHAEPPREDEGAERREEDVQRRADRVAALERQEPPEQEDRRVERPVERLPEQRRAAHDRRVPGREDAALPLALDQRGVGVEEPELVGEREVLGAAVVGEARRRDLRAPRQQPLGVGREEEAAAEERRREEGERERGEGWRRWRARGACRKDRPAAARSEAAPSASGLRASTRSEWPSGRSAARRRKRSLEKIAASSAFNGRGGQ